MPGVIERNNVIEGSVQPLSLNSVPTNGTTEVQSLAITGTPTGGTFTLSFGGYTTAPIAYNASAAAVQTALQALPSIGAGNLTASGGALPGTAVTLTFAGSLAVSNVSQITANGALLTGGTTPVAAVTTTTDGVTASFKNAPTGLIVEGTADGVAYVNSSMTPGLPTWTHIGAQV